MRRLAVWFACLGSPLAIAACATSKAYPDPVLPISEIAILQGAHEKGGFFEPALWVAVQNLDATGSPIAFGIDVARSIENRRTRARLRITLQAGYSYTIHFDASAGIYHASRKPSTSLDPDDLPFAPPRDSVACEERPVPQGEFGCELLPS